MPEGRGQRKKRNPRKNKPVFRGPLLPAEGIQRERIPAPEAEADKQALFLRTLALIEKGEKADFYSRVLQYAELKEREEKGGAEKAIRRHWGELQQMERGIKRRYEKLREGCR